MSKGLIFLQSKSAILHENLAERVLNGKREPCEISFADFDGVSFRITVQPDRVNIVVVAMAMNMVSVIKPLGAQDTIDKLYPGCERTPPSGFDFAIEFDCDAIPGESPEKFLKDVSEMKHNIMGGPILKSFNALLNRQSGGLPTIAVQYRKTESFFIVHTESKVTIIFLVDFSDITDKALAKVFLQEFMEAQRIVRNAPPVTFTKDVPPDLKKVPHNSGTDIAGYISFAVEERHIKGDANLEKAVALMTGFRNYLHYHIKCSKTYLHMRMRKRVAGWMQVLKRAIPDADEKEKKTSAGKTFVRK